MVNTSHAGHGGVDPGAVGNGYREADIARLYNTEYCQLTGAINATDDTAVSVNDNLNKIVQNVNRHADGNSWSLSWHLNAASPAATGVEVFYYAPDNAAKAKAEAISAKLASIYGIPNRGAKPSPNFYVISNTAGHMLLIELGFITNANDVKQVLNKRSEAVRAVAAIMGYIVATPSPKPPVASTSTIAMKVTGLTKVMAFDMLPKVQKSYANVVSKDRAFKAKTGSTWKVRLTYINFGQAKVICDQLRKAFPKYSVEGYRINAKDTIVDSTPFAVEVANVPQSDIENVLKHVQQTYAGIITADRIFLTPATEGTYWLEMKNVPKGDAEVVKRQLIERYKVNPRQVIIG